MFEGINWLAVLLAAASAFALGGIWYGPLFKRAWCRENGMDPDAPPKGHPGMVFGTAFVAALVAAAAFAIILRPEPSLFVALHDKSALAAAHVFRDQIGRVDVHPFERAFGAGGFDDDPANAQRPI